MDDTQVNALINDALANHTASTSDPIARSAAASANVAVSELEARVKTLESELTAVRTAMTGG